MRKRIFHFLFAILLLCLTSVTVLAHDVPDFHQSGSITVNLQDEGKKLSSGTLTFYRVGEIISTNGNYYFRPTGSFSSCGASLEDVRSSELARKLLDYAENQNLSGETAKIQDGTVRYEIGSNQLGLYLVAQHQATTGYHLLDPFLISVPNSEHDAYVYDVDATPKVGVLTETTPTVPPVAPPTDTVLPQTGQLKFPVPMLAILGLGLIGSGLLLRVIAKSKENEI